MARIRTIKPEFWKHEDLCALPESTHMLAGALLNYADDFGYFNANPALVKAECCPLREPTVSIPESLRSLQEIGYIALGTCEKGRRYGVVCNFNDHQRVSHPSKSKIQGMTITWDDSGNPPEEIVKAPEIFGPEQGTGKGTGNREQGKESGADAPDFASMFATLWDSWPKGHGLKGSRQDAEVAFLKLKPDKILFATMLRAVDAQARSKAKDLASTGFAESFPHVERWIKKQRWTDEISEQHARPNGRVSKSDEADAAYAEQLARIARGNPEHFAHAEGDGVDFLPAGQH